jgi:phosphohistidine phosphatase
MQLHILRHAEAEDASPTGLDSDRRLTEAGRKRMKTVAAAIAKALSPRYDAILISPLVRARETATPVAEACGFTRALRVTEALSPHASPDAVVGEVARLGVDTVLAVGHEPHMGRLFGRLLTGGSRLEVPMKKASLAVFETEADAETAAWELRLYAPARLLERLA